MRKAVINVRQIEIEDAENWLNLLKQLNKESNFMLYTENDREFNLNKCKEHIKNIRNNLNTEILLAENSNKQIVGYLLGETCNIQKKNHIMSICGGVLKEYHQGLGRNLIEGIIYIAKKRGIKRLELSVLNSNKICINTCRKMGFVSEGIKISAVRVDDTYEDELMMGMLL